MEEKILKGPEIEPILVMKNITNFKEGEYLFFIGEIKPLEWDVERRYKTFNLNTSNERFGSFSTLNIPYSYLYGSLIGRKLKLIDYNELNTLVKLIYENKELYYFRKTMNQFTIKDFYFDHSDFRNLFFKNL